MVDVATLEIRVDSSEAAKASKDIDRLKNSSSKVSGEIDRLGSVARRVSGILGTLAGAAIAAFAAPRVISVIADFETSMSRVGAIARATASELDTLRATARELGATTEFSATQAADGLSFLAMAGFTARESVEAIPAVLDLATASMMNLGSTADITSNIISGFGLAASEAADVADVLAAASTRSNTNVSQLGQAMSTAAPIAKSLGIGLEETAAAIGTMSDAGIQGERAGTALRGVLASLAGPTSQAADALSKYGLSVEDVNVEAHGFSGVLDTLRKAGIETGDAMQIFGREAASGALVMIEGAERVAGFTEELRAADGAAGDMAATMRDNLGGDLKTLGSVVQDLIITLGESGLTAVIRAAVQGTTRAISFLSANLETIQGVLIAAAGAATFYYAPAMIASAIATGRLVTSLITLRGALISTGIGALIVASGVLIGEFIKIVKATGGIGEAFTVLGEISGLVWKGIGDSAGAIVPALSAVWEKVKSEFYVFIADLSYAWADFLSFFKVGLEAIGAVDTAELLATGPIASATKAGNDALMAAEEASGRAAKNMAEAGAVVADAFGPATDRMRELKAVVDEVSASVSGVGAPGVTDTGTGTGTDGTGGGGGGGKGGGADKIADDFKNRWEELQKGFRSEFDLTVVEYQKHLETLNWALGQKLISEQEFQRNKAMLYTMSFQGDYERDQLQYQLELDALVTARQNELIAEEDFIRKRNELYSSAVSQIGQNTDNLYALQLGQLAGHLGEMSQLAGGGYDKLLKAQQVFAAASALVSTYQGAAKALELPFPYNIAAAGKVIAAGLGFVSAIKGSGGGSGGAAGGGGASAGGGAQAAAQTAPNREVLVRLEGDEWLVGMADSIMTQIYEQTGDGRVIVQRDL